MKSSPIQKESAVSDLMLAISLINNKEEAWRFLTDLCTPAELEAMADRWRVIPLLRKNLPYRTIHEQTGVSVTTITRVSRCLSFGTGGYQVIAHRLEGL